METQDYDFEREAYLDSEADSLNDAERVETPAKLSLDFRNRADLVARLTLELCREDITTAEIIVAIARFHDTVYTLGAAAGQGMALEILRGIA